MRAGEVIDERFELLEIAGIGGMGTVFRARDRFTHLDIALKNLRDPQAGAEARFASEARLLAGLRHPHIVQYVTHGTSIEGEPYLVMEWLNGESLADRLQGEIPTINETLTLARHVADALGAAHTRGIVHRDIKPSNLFLPERSFANAKLLDFGIARLDAATSPLTHTRSILGTPGYMAPEQARGERGNVDARADVFAFGCVLFECLTGRPAFQGVHIMALLAKLLMEDPPQVDEFRPDVPATLSNLITRMLSKDPAKRPADGRAILKALERVGQEETVPMLKLDSGLESITEIEKRLVSVVALVPAAATATNGLATTIPAQGIPQKMLTQARSVLEPLGAKVEELANGVLVILLVGEGPATDRAALAARSAFRMRGLIPDAPIVLLTGRSEKKGRLPVGEVLDRAASLLIEAGAMREGKPIRFAPIHIDSLTKALLDVRFEVTNSDSGWLLHEEREVGGEARTLLGKPSPFIGREREFLHLCSLIEESIEEKTAHAVLMTSFAGMGKSRIRYEMMRKLRERYPERLKRSGQRLLLP